LDLSDRSAGYFLFADRVFMPGLNMKNHVHFAEKRPSGGINMKFHVYFGSGVFNMRNKHEISTILRQLPHQTGNKHEKSCSFDAPA